MDVLLQDSTHSLLSLSDTEATLLLRPAEAQGMIALARAANPDVREWAFLARPLSGCGMLLLCDHRIYDALKTARPRHPIDDEFLALLFIKDFLSRREFAVAK